MNYFNIDQHIVLSFKGTVSREKCLNCGLWEMDWTLIIDYTWVLHFPDQLILYNCLTVCRLDVKPVWWLPATAAFRRLILHAVVVWRMVNVSMAFTVHTTQISFGHARGAKWFLGRTTYSIKMEQIRIIPKNPMIKHMSKFSKKNICKKSRGTVP